MRAVLTCTVAARLAMAVALVAGAAAAPVARAGESPAGELATMLVAESGVGAGVCVHVGATDGALEAEMAAAGNFIVQGLAVDPAALAKAREGLFARKSYGVASVEAFSPQRLPYAENLVNLVVAEDFAALARQGLTATEVLRVVVPKGVLFLGLKTEADEKAVREKLAEAGVKPGALLKKCGLWLKVVKPRAAHLDDWSHAGHDAAGTWVSRDDVSDAPGGIQWLGGPAHGQRYGSAEGRACKAAVAAGGRVFTVVGRCTHINTPEEYEAAAAKVDRKKLGYSSLDVVAFGTYTDVLRAQDASNGMILWTLDAKIPGYQPSIVAGEDRLYAIFDGAARALDAATGKELLKYEFVPGKSPGGMRLYGGYLVLSGNMCPTRVVEAATGKLCWEARDGISAIDEDKAFTMSWNGKYLCARDLKTGTEIWKKDMPSVSGGKASLCFVKNGVVVCTAGPAVGFSAKDGKQLWTYEDIPKGNKKLQLFLAGNLVWLTAELGDKALHKQGKRYWFCGLDPQTGEKKAEHFAGFTGISCYKQIATERFFSFGRPTAMLYWKDGSKHYCGLARQGCYLGFIHAYGMLYGFPTHCGCMTGVIRGFPAMCPAHEVRPPAPEKRLEKGPAYGAAPGAEPDAADWPAFLHDSRRSCVASSPAAGGLEVLWRSDVDVQGAPRPEIAAHWAMNSLDAGKLTAPVVAGGTVFVGGVESHRLYALDAKDGSTKWTFTAGGRLDAPPTIYKGMCLLGSADGCVYCLRAADGQLVWRFRAAPEERQVMIFSQLESAWPVQGGVVVDKDVVFCMAGRSSRADGGLYAYALDPATGKVLLPIEPVSNAKCGDFGWGGIVNDLLSAGGGHVGLARGRGTVFEMPGGPDSIQAGPPIGRGGCQPDPRVMDRSWMRNPGNNVLIRYSHTPVVSDGKMICSFGYPKNRVNVPAGLNLSCATAASKGKEVVWKWDAPGNYQVEAMVMAGDSVLAAGPLERWCPDKGKLYRFALADGKPSAEVELEGSPVPDGLAVAGGRVYVSTRDGKVLCLGKK